MGASNSTGSDAAGIPPGTAPARQMDSDEEDEVFHEIITTSDESGMARTRTQRENTSHPGSSPGASAIIAAQRPGMDQGAVGNSARVIIIIIIISSIIYKAPLTIKVKH